MSDFVHDPYTKDRPENPVEPLLRMILNPPVLPVFCGPRIVVVYVPAVSPSVVL